MENSKGLIGLNEKEKKSLTGIIFFVVLVLIFFGTPFHLKVFLTMVFGIVAYIFAQCFHEFGHWITHLVNGYNPEMHFNRSHLPYKVTSKDTQQNPFTSYNLKLASAFGVLFGIIPIWIYHQLFQDFLFTSAVLFLYAFACRHDFNDLINEQNINSIETIEE